VPTKLARFTVNIPEELAKSVEDLARQDQRSVSKYLALIIQQHVDQVSSVSTPAPQRSATDDK
jgi:metal-responsive CopG/Arc/MetJ family transcriptional regulator